jgi:hypothetical protein
MQRAAEHTMTRLFSVAVLLGMSSFAAGCTTLGPMPATSGASVVPAGRPDVRLSATLTPGYYLSTATQESSEATAVRQLGADFEPDRWISLPGLHAGVRYVGEPSEGGYAEPQLGYRRSLDAEGRFAVGVLAYGGYASGSAKGASFEATRGGGEIGANARVTPQSSLVELHVSASAALVGLSSEGSYCLDSQGRYGVDCGEPPTALVDAEASGLYPSITGGLALEAGRHLDSPFHGVRLELLGSAGSMPRVEYGQQASARAYYSAGAGISVALGAK